MNDTFELMKARHSVRSYLDKPVEEEIRSQLVSYAQTLNAESGLNIQIIFDEPSCFDSRMAHYGKFENCSNYISMVGKKSPSLDMECGYYGELLVLKAQELGLNTCWVALTHGKSKAVVADDEKEAIIISLGYGKIQGTERKSKTPEEVSNVSADSPQWFKDGIAAALLAPTAVNQQKFRFTLSGNKVSVKPGLIGSCLKIDLGIVKCHFELGAGKDNFEWV